MQPSCPPPPPASGTVSRHTYWHPAGFSLNPRPSDQRGQDVCTCEDEIGTVLLFPTRYLEILAAKPLEE